MKDKALGITLSSNVMRAFRRTKKLLHIYIKVLGCRQYNKPYKKKLFKLTTAPGHNPNGSSQIIFWHYQILLPKLAIAIRRGNFQLSELQTGVHVAGGGRRQYLYERIRAAHYNERRSCLPMRKVRTVLLVHNLDGKP